MADVDEAAPRWAIQFGLTERSREDGRALLSCDDEPCALELIEGGQPGHDHTGFELRRSCSLDDAKRHLDAHGVAFEEREGCLFVADPDGNGVQLMPYRELTPEQRLTPHARPTTTLPGDHPRKLGHVNFLTGAFRENDRLLHGRAGHAADGLPGRGRRVAPHQRRPPRDGPDRQGRARTSTTSPSTSSTSGRCAWRSTISPRHGRWLGWGPTRHGVGGNIASYVRIVEEECFVELYVDMEQIDIDHEPRRWPDDRFSSNTWGPLPPRSYFRFDEAAIASERESLETLGIPLGDALPT